MEFPRQSGNNINYNQNAQFNSSFTDSPLIKLTPETDYFLKEDPLSSPWAPYRLQLCARAHRKKIKMQENIASMPLTILVGNFQPCM